MIYKREEGEVQPGWHWGRFTVRIPGIHVRLNWPMTIQGGLIHVGFAASAVALKMEYFDMPFEVAWSMSVIYMFWMFIGTLFLGEPYSPGWITPALPLTLMYLQGFTPGTEAVKAMTALALTVGLVFLLLGVTGLGRKIYELVPSELRAGIIMGAAIAAFLGEFERLEEMPVTLFAVYGFTILFLYSVWFTNLQLKNKLLERLAHMTILVGFAIGAIVGISSGEVSITIETWGSYTPQFGEYLSSVLPYYIGWPSLDMYLSALPIAFIAYVVAFGDMIVANTLIEDADNARKDEDIQIDTTRTHYSLAIRNIFQILTGGPFIPMHGPIFAGGTVFLIKVYSESRKTLDSLYEGTCNFNWFGLLMAFLGPAVFFFGPLADVGLGITLIITGVACAQLAMRIVTTIVGYGYILLVGLIFGHYGPQWGLLFGVLLYFWLVYEREPKDPKKGPTEES
ncbi:hypothetical protein [Natranaerofaba carboxydovora]|uniref:hypothetical protein n=1 Tax=Natranaerofaba carboxydovora TaxID=2742683 RepID=UPI001F144CC7|nr:hypothetical protein [Natranaerofaba carboxydovora]UMZ73565.1 hypothetical protein ACONDI_01120 [Natranaerofaba carboxydovora]